MIVFTYNPWLVMLSVVISMMSAFTGLSLTRGLSKQPVGQRQVRIIMAAITLGGGIWSMHFVAMLAMRFGVPVFYEVIETVASALVAMLLAGLSLLILHFGRRTQVSIVASGMILGLGIVVMHYLGLSAIEGCRPVYQPVGIAVAGTLALGMGVAAVQIAYGKRTERNVLLATAVFGASVAVVHFSAMAWTGFRATEAVSTVAPVITNPQVAIVLLVSAFVISGAFLLTSASFFNREPVVVGLSVLPPPVPAGEPAAPLSPARLPYVKDGKTFFLPFARISAIRAEGHYTTAYLDQGTVFCPWSISQVEEAMPPGFLRVHRGWLVNVAHVQGFQRTRDNGFCLLDPKGPLDRVPVSRAKVNTVRDALGL